MTRYVGQAKPRCPVFLSESFILRGQEKYRNFDSCCPGIVAEAVATYAAG